MSKITLDDTPADAIAKLCDGNVGALNVCIELLKQGAAIDPDAFSEVSTLLALDDLGLYGPAIWLLYKDHCGQNIARVIAVLRAVQLGFLSPQRLVDACQERVPGGTPLDVPGLYQKARQRLPAFDPENIACPL